MAKILTPFTTLALLAAFFVSTTQAAPDVRVEDLDTTYSEYLTAIYARQAGDVERATENYLRVLKKDPENKKILEEAYTYYLYTGDFKNSVDLAKRLQRLDITHASSSMILALDSFKRGRSDDMNFYLGQARGFGFDILVGPLMRAWLLADDGKIDEALLAMESLRVNLGFEPFYAEHAAFMLDKNGLDEDAEAAYLSNLAREEITSLQPLLAYAAFLQRQKRSDEALRLLQDFAPSVPNNRQIREAIEKLEKGRKLTSIVDYREVAVSMALLRAAVQLTREQAFYPGVVYARFSLFLNPDFDEGSLFLGNMLSNENNPGLALTAYEAVDPDGPFGETALLRRAMVLSFHDRRQEGIDLALAYLEDNPDSQDTLVSLGDLYRGAENYKEALPYYERAFALKEEITPEDWFLLFTRAISYERLDMWEKAEADFLAALEYQPDDADILNYLGYSWIDRGMNLEEGRAMIEKAVAARPDSGYIIDSLGWAQYLMGEYEEAVENLEKAVTLEPGDPTINDHLGDAYWKAGREREARFQWDHALKLNPDADVAEVLNQKLISGLEPEEDTNETS